MANVQGSGYQMAYGEKVSAVTATPSTPLGSRRREGLNDYIYCYNVGNSEIYPGYGVVLSANSQCSVTLTTITGDVCFAVVKHATMTTGTYAWLCTKGPAKVEIGDTVIADHTAVTGTPVALMSLGKFYGIVSGSAGTGTTWSAFGVVGVTLDSIATNASGSVWLNCAAG